MCYSKREIKRILNNNGWTLHHQKGSHAIYKNKNGQHITIPVVQCNQLIFKRIIKEHHLVIY